MKARELGYLLGLRPSPRTYGFEVKRFLLPTDGPVDYAQWLHPGETPKQVRQEEVDQLRTLLAPGDVAIDVGAHTGDSTIPMALAVGPQGRVLALEPNPYVFPILQENARLNPGRTAIVPLNFAATPATGDVEFEYSDAGFCNGGRHEGISRWRHAHAFKLVVRGEHLHMYLLNHHADLIRKIRYIKVDAEGYDFDVLTSLADLLRSQRPVVRAEVYKLSSTAQRGRLYGLMVSLGYEVMRFDSEGSYRGQPLSLSDMTRWPHFDILCLPRRPLGE